MLTNLFEGTGRLIRICSGCDPYEVDPYEGEEWENDTHVACGLLLFFSSSVAHA